MRDVRRGRSVKMTAERKRKGFDDVSLIYGKINSSRGELPLRVVKGVSVKQES